jgi:hypothetical protein
MRGFRLIRARLAASCVLAGLFWAALALGPCGTSAEAAAPVTITDYTNQAEALTWGQHSHWKQPWRSYLDTVPGSTLRDAVGVNFNVQPKAAASTARLLAEEGFHRARVEIGWNSIAYNDPSQLSESGLNNLETYISAFRENNIRPLILLNANDGQPCPISRITLHLTQPAGIGVTTIHILPSDLATVVPGRTGISANGKSAYELIKSVESDGTATLSKPLAAAYPVGELKAETLRYEPFRSPLLTSGSLNPRFEATLAGWLSYVGVVTREVKRLLGSERFDVEIWNELGFGSAFLNINNYYTPHLEEIHGTATDYIRDRTLTYLRDPIHGVPDIGIGNGFANQRPWANGTQSPLGLSAIDKHPYSGWAHFPSELLLSGRPLNGLGEPSGWLDEQKHYHEDFIPEYDAFFPERFLSGINTETLVHDLSPYPSSVGGVEHGRNTHPEGGSPPQMWITEVNLDPTSGPTPATQMSQADVRHVETKEVLRYLTAYVNKGVTALDLYAASAGHLSVIDKSFVQEATSNPTVYPGRDTGGETVDAVRRLTEAMKGFRITEPRSLELKSLTDYDSNVQFEGDSADPVHFPALYNRDVFAFLPFQTSNSRFVIPVYVMTRNVVKDYRPDNSEDPTRFDLPEEPYRLQISGVDGIGTTVTATDPVTGHSTPVEVVKTGEDEVTVEMQVTDSPRLLILEEGGEPRDQEPEAGEGLPVNVGQAPPESTDPLTSIPESTEGGNGEEPDVGVDPGSFPGDKGQSKSDAPALPQADLAAQVELHGIGSLLNRRLIRVKGHCAPACALLIVGRLAIGDQHPYRMFQQPRHAVTKSENPQLKLGVIPRMAKIARREMDNGIQVRIVISGFAEYGSGTSQPVHTAADLHLATQNRNKSG